MKESVYKNYEELPLFLNAETVAKVLGVVPSTAYELMYEADFPTLKIGNRIVVPKEQFKMCIRDRLRDSLLTKLMNGEINVDGI